MNKRKLSITLVSTVIIIFALFFLWKNNSEHAIGVPSSDFKDATYEIDERQIKLKDGMAETEIEPGSISRITTEYFGNEARGDLNADGTEDVVFIVTQDTGGSGIFFYVVAALLGEDGYTGTNAISLGDRIAPQMLQIKNGEIIVNYADRAEYEAMTTRPSRGISLYLKVRNHTLYESR